MKVRRVLVLCQSVLWHGLPDGLEKPAAAAVRFLPVPGVARGFLGVVVGVVALLLGAILPREHSQTLG